MLFSRAGSNDLRINVPTVQAYEASDDYPPGGWHWGDDGGASPGTVGSPLTEPSRIRVPQVGGDMLPAVTRCSTILTGAVVRTRWYYTDRRGAPVGRPAWVEDPMGLGPLQGPVFPLVGVAQRLGSQEFFETLMLNAMLWGRGPFVFVESSAGAPLAGSCIPLNPFAVTDNPDQSWRIGFDGEEWFDTDPEGRFAMGGQMWRAAVLRGPGPHFRGMAEGVLGRHWRTFRVGAHIDRYVAGFFKSGIPTGYLSVSTPNFGVQVEDPENPGELVWEQDLLKREWQRAHGNDERSTAVLNASVSYTPVSVKPIDAEIEQVKRASRTDVAHAFGMSSIWVDEGASGLSYSNSSERRADLVSMTAASWGERFTDLVTSLTPGVVAAVAWPTFVSPSLETVLPTLVPTVQAGIMTANEARQVIGLDPWTGRDPAFTDRSPASGREQEQQP